MEKVADAVNEKVRPGSESSLSGTAHIKPKVDTRQGAPVLEQSLMRPTVVYHPVSEERCTELWRSGNSVGRSKAPGRAGRDIGVLRHK